MDLNRQIQEAANIISAATNIRPEIGLILGSGLGDFADTLENSVNIPYSALPSFPLSTVEGHAGQFVIGEKCGKSVIAMQGRVHCYEGYTAQTVAMPVRIMKLLGVNKLLLTNAAGGVNKSYPVGSLMMISDHINYSGQNPLTGANLDSFGPRFPDMSEVYSKRLRNALREKAAENNIPLEEGVYVMFSGPSYETPAEIRMARTMGADAVGMSTVPEAITARHCGMEVMGISCISNPAAGILDQPLNHQDVMEASARVKSTFLKLVDIILAQVF